MQPHDFRPAASRLVTAVRTRRDRLRFRTVATWGRGGAVLDPLRLTGPGAIVIGDDCVLGSVHGDTNAIEAAGAGAVRIGDGCRLNRFAIVATDNVTIGAGVTVRGRLHIAGSGRVTIGDGCDINALDIVAAGDVTIGSGVLVREYARVDGGGRVDVGERCKINSIDISSSGEIRIGRAVTVRTRAHLGGEGTTSIGSDTTLESGGLDVHTDGPAAVVRIGEQCGVNGVDIYATDSVTIGDRCMLGSCSMATTDFHSTRPDRWSRDVPAKRGAISIGTNVWIANKTVINKGVSIGNNSVVSTGSVIREDVPPDVIVTSHEQRIVKHLPSRQDG